MSGLSWSTVLAEVNARVGRSFTFRQQLPGGRQAGAWLVQDAADQRAVLTWTVNHGLARRRPETKRLVQRLQGRGYPTPAWIAAGVLEGDVVFELAEYAQGRHVPFMEVPIARVLAAIELQAGLASPTASSWSDYAWSLLRDQDGPRAYLGRLSADGHAFAGHLDTLMHDLGHVVLPADDAVHGDMGTYNILVDQDAIAIIDIAACGPGTRALDYAWLLRQAQHELAPAGILRSIRTAGQKVAGRDVFTVCLMAAVIEMAAFSAQRGHLDAARQELRRARGLLTDWPETTYRACQQRSTHDRIGLRHVANNEKGVLPE